MKVYQCIHKYPAHISGFEERAGVSDATDFATLHRKFLADGYASTYILHPALDNRPEEIFYTVWDYERLQWKWADEHGLKTRDLDEIKLAQIEEFNPDVFYNMSPFCDRDFIKRLGKRKGRIDICWNAFVRGPRPSTFGEYEGHVSLHRPYVEFWREQGLKALELQPAMPQAWEAFESIEPDVDVLFYGQLFRGIFDNRIRLVEDLLRYGLERRRDLRCHLTYPERGWVLRIPGMAHFRIKLPISRFPGRLVRKHSLSPLYGEELYRTVSKSRVVVNLYGDENRDFKSNMRLFEATGLGAFLISEAGDYPDGFEPGVDFYTFKDSTELVDQIERVLSDWPRHAEIARRTRQKITALYSKQQQWLDFQHFVREL